MWNNFVEQCNLLTMKHLKSENNSFFKSILLVKSPDSAIM